MTSQSSPLSERQAFIEERKNWDFVKVPKSSVNVKGEKITFCPQDPFMIRRILSFYSSCLDPNSVFFASGEATGWASLAFVGTGHSVLISEPDVSHCESLIQNLKKMIAGAGAKKNQSEKEKRQAAKWAEQQQEKKRALEEKRNEMTDDIITKFPSMSKELVSDIIDIIATSVVDDEVSLTQQVSDVASKMSQGLAHIHVSLGGHIYTLSSDQWKQIADKLPDENSKLIYF